MNNTIEVFHWRRLSPIENPDCPLWILTHVASVNLAAYNPSGDPLEMAWCLTEHAPAVGGHWPNNPGVVCWTLRPRSNMVGDIYFRHSDHTWHRVEGIGFSRLSETPVFTTTHHPRFTYEGFDDLPAHTASGDHPLALPEDHPAS